MEYQDVHSKLNLMEAKISLIAGKMKDDLNCKTSKLNKLTLMENTSIDVIKVLEEIVQDLEVIQYDIGK